MLCSRIRSKEKNGFSTGFDPWTCTVLYVQCFYIKRKYFTQYIYTLYIKVKCLLYTVHVSTVIFFTLKERKKIARSKNAAQSTSHQLSRCQVVLNKRPKEIECCQSLSFWVLSQFELLGFSQFKFLSFVTILVSIFLSILVFSCPEQL